MWRSKLLSRTLLLLHSPSPLHSKLLIPTPRSFCSTNQQPPPEPNQTPIPEPNQTPIPETTETPIPEPTNFPSPREKLLSILRTRDSHFEIPSTPHKLELQLTDYQFISSIIYSPNTPPHVSTFENIERLVSAVTNSTDLTKDDAHVLWHFVKHNGVRVDGIATNTLNSLIHMFSKLDNPKASLEVFNTFEQLGCCANANSYYYIIRAMAKGKKHWLSTAWGVCEKMMKSESLPDENKIGEIVVFFSRGGMVREAHSVYSIAKGIVLPRRAFDVLIKGLAKKDESVGLAVEVLRDYPDKSFGYANVVYGKVVKALCRVGKPSEAKKLLMEMVESGPRPGSATFNYVITGLCKGGDVEEAVSLVKVMESCGLRPDVYTYTVIMSGFAKGGAMDEAYKVFGEAKKKHKKLCPVSYHTLIRGYCKMEEFGKAVECLKEMREDGIKPNADEYHKLIKDLCFKGVDWRSAEKLMEEMKESDVCLRGKTRVLIASLKELVQEESEQLVVNVAE